MRTAPIALAYLHHPDALVQTAQGLSSLTHHDPEAGEACVLWCLAIRHAVLDGTLNIRNGLQHLPADRRQLLACVQRPPRSSRRALTCFART
jgi:ADP-ribosylglycohydrolase